MPAFEGGQIEREAIYWEHEGNRAIRVGKWKLVAKGKRGAWELYDLESDRTEMHDLSAADPDRVHEMARQWQAWAERAHVLPLGAWQASRAKKQSRKPAAKVPAASKQPKH